MPQTTTSQISAPLTEIYNRELLDNLYPSLLFKRFGTPPVVVARGSGSITVKWRRYGKISARTTSLTEGTTPTSTQWSKSDITATLLHKGDWVELSDEVSVVNVDPIVEALVAELAAGAADSYDQLCSGVVVAGSNVLYSSGDASRAAVAHLMTTGDLDKAIRTLSAANVPKITSMINASVGVGTSPVAPCYVGIVHPLVSYTLKGLSGFVPVEQYSSTMALLPNEIGKYREIRFCESSNAPYLAGSNGVVGANGTTYRNTASYYDVYLTMILGAGAYGSVNLDETSPQIIVKPVGSSGSEDPLNQRGSLGWTGWNIDKILDDNRMVRLETCAAL